MSSLDSATCHACGRSRYEPHHGHSYAPVLSTYDPTLGFPEPNAVIAKGATHSRRAAVGAILLSVAVVAGWIALTVLFEHADKRPAYLVIAMMIACFVAMFVLARALRHEVFVSADGLVERSRDGTEISIRWDESHDLFLHGVRLWIGPIPTAGQMTATVVTSDGRKITTHSSSIRANGGVVAAVHAQSTRANFAPIAMRIHAGETVAFGAITLTRDEISIGRQRAAIGDITDVRIVDGYLRLKLRGSWFDSKTALRRIANYDCLLRLIDPNLRR